MENKEGLPKRKTMRMMSHDYSAAGVYFITICTKDRRCLLSHVVGTGVPDGPSLALTSYGEIAKKYIRQLNDFYDHLSIEHYVIMPNHVHLLLWVKGGPSGTPVPTGEYAGGKNAAEGRPDACRYRLRYSVASPLSGTPVPTAQNSIVARFVSTFKRFCNKEYGENIWQARSYDHIIRDREDYQARVKYILENPARWCFDELYTEK